MASKPSGNKATEPAETGVSNADKAASAGKLREDAADNVSAGATKLSTDAPGAPARADREPIAPDDLPPQYEQRPGAQPLTEPSMTVEEIIDARTPTVVGFDWPKDGRYRHVFFVEKPRTSQPKNRGAADDWADEDGSMASMHEANKVATLQWALAVGLHPTGPAELDQIVGVDDEDAVGVSLVYAVPVVPASLQAPEEASNTYTPSAALGDLGGTTLAERTTAPEGHLAKGTADSIGSKEMAADNDGRPAAKE
jgi:hypothetical protein